MAKKRTPPVHQLGLVVRRDSPEWVAAQLQPRLQDYMDSIERPQVCGQIVLEGPCAGKKMAAAVAKLLDCPEGYKAVASGDNIWLDPK